MSRNYANDFIQGLRAGGEIFHDQPLRRQAARQGMQVQREGADINMAREQDRVLDRERQQAIATVEDLAFDDFGRIRTDWSPDDATRLIGTMNSRDYDDWRKRHKITGEITQGWLA